MKHNIYLTFICVVVLGISLKAQPLPDRHSTSKGDAWMSCTASANPNAIRGNGHWFMIDFGDTYALQNSTLWNFNTPERINSFENASWSITPLPGKLIDGVKDIVIDISVDGVTWIEWGRYSVPMANGSSTYQGVIGPNFEGKIAKKILITAINNHGGTCYGLGEIRINGSIATVSNTNDILASATLTASPNPFIQSTRVDLGGFPNGNARLILTDMTGREIFQNTIKVVGDSATYTIGGSDLPSGLYFLTAEAAGGAKTIKIEVIK